MARQFLRDKALSSDLIYHMEESVYTLISKLNYIYARLFGRKYLKLDRRGNGTKTQSSDSRSKFMSLYKFYLREFERREMMRKDHKRSLEDLAEEDRTYSFLLREIQDVETKAKALKNLESMQVRREKRALFHQELKLKTQKYKPYSETPLFKQAEERFRDNRCIHKRVESSSPVKDELEEHLNWYDSVKIIRPKIKIAHSHMSTPLGRKVFLADKDDTEVREQQNYVSENRMKKKRFADLVKTHFVPKIDTAKQREIKERIERFSKSKMDLKNTRSTSENTIKWAPKKFPVNPLVPAPNSKKEAQMINYLEELKKQRHNRKLSLDFFESFSSGNSSQAVMNRIKRMNDMVDFQVNKNNILIQTLGTNTKSLKASQDTGDLLIKSIKAKIGVLGKFDDKNS